MTGWDNPNRNKKCARCNGNMPTYHIVNNRLICEKCYEYDQKLRQSSNPPRPLKDGPIKQILAPQPLDPHPLSTCLIYVWLIVVVIVFIAALIATTGGAG